MTSKEIVIKMIGTIKTLYQYAFKDLDKDQYKFIIDIWYDSLKDYDEEIVTIAFKKTLQDCKMQPTLADIIEHIKELQNAGVGNDAELWNILDTARQKVATICGLVLKIIYPN